MKKVINYCLMVLTVLNLTFCALVESNSPSRAGGGPEIKSVRPDVLSEYKAFYVAPVHVYAVQGDILRRVDERETIDLAEGFRAKVIRELDSKYTSFPQPAGGTALLKISISDISTNYAALQLRPGMLVPNNMRGGAAIEAKFVDSVSGKEILVYKDSQQGERKGYFSGLGKWDGVKKAFDDWAKQLGDTVNAY